MPQPFPKPGLPPYLQGDGFLALEDSEFPEVLAFLRIMKDRILHQRGQRRDREVETELVVEHLQPCQQAKRLGVSIETAEVVMLFIPVILPFRKPLSHGHLALMAKGWIAEVVGQSDRREECRDVSLDLQRLVVVSEHPLCLVERDAYSDTSGQVADFVRVCQSVPDGGVLLHGEYLGLVR